jgi:Helix-turn-helix domain
MNAIQIPTKYQPRQLGELLTTQEVCEKIKRGPHTIRRWELRGLITAFRPGGGRRKLYRLADIEALVTGQRGDRAKEAA